MGPDKKPEDALRLLERLADLDILKRTFVDLVSCPVCNSTLLTSHYRCPKCGKGHLHRSGLIEHIPCGNITERDTYYKGTTVPTCPKCGKKLEEGFFRDMGVWYQCVDCGERFEHPEIELICRSCDARAQTETALVKQVWKYSLNPLREAEVRQNVTSLEAIRDFLASEGFTIEPSGAITGVRSGIQHTFSILARKLYEDERNIMRTRILTVDHAVSETEVTASPLILYTYKLSEVKVDIPIFVAIPRISETAKKIAHANKIIIVQGNPKDKSQLNDLKHAIEQRIREKIEEDRAEKAGRAEKIVISSTILDLGDRKIEVWRDQHGRFQKKPG